MANDYQNSAGTHVMFWIIFDRSSLVSIFACIFIPNINWATACSDWIDRCFLDILAV